MITNDVPAQAKKAFDVIGQARPGECVLDNTVLVEVTFVLEYHIYAMARTDIADALLDIANHAAISVSDNAVRALHMYKGSPRLDFVDCLLAISADMKKGNLLTFDRDLQKALRP